MSAVSIWANILRVLAALLAVSQPTFASAAATLSVAEPRIQAGAELTLHLTLTNESTSVETTDITDPLHIRVETAEGVSIVAFEPDKSGPLNVEPGTFAKVTLKGPMPNDADGIGTLTSTGLIANPVLVEFTAPAPTDVASTREPQLAASDANAATQRSTLIDKPPPLAVSVYEPVYFIVGGDDGLNAKFQISLRYRLFDGRGQLAERLPWIDDLYLSYSQTSLWDLDDLSKPFRDSSYRPRLFFSNYDLGRLLDGRLRLGIEAGAGHESNGKEGEDSRSFNMLYARPVLTFGDPDGLRAYLAPLVHNYISKDENPNIHHYRGYVDWLFGIGSKGGLDFSATVRRGTRSNYGSVELNASYPLSKLSGGDLTGWLMLQYFGGYGESLLDYDRKLDAQLRLGIAIAL
jgi:phospholipase A1/A2